MKVTRKFETSAEKVAQPILELSDEEDDEYEFLNLNEFVLSLPKTDDGSAHGVGEKTSAINQDQGELHEHGFKTSSPQQGSVTGDFGFEVGAQERVDSVAHSTSGDMVEWVQSACDTIKDMVETDPLKPGEVDGVEIVGFMDGVRMVSRLKKRLTEEVDEFCYGAVNKSCPTSGARTVQGSESGLDSGSQTDGGFPGEL